ncbi:MAG: heat shock protein transcriptional repressor HspR [Streptosporangiaceae bacterium]
MISDSDFELSDDTPVYVISVAAQLSGMHPQTLRAYDRLGLVSPGRAAGRGRRYSLRDILILREVQRLSQEEGINLSGIKRILALESAEQRSRLLLAELQAEISQLRAELESTRAVAARLAALLRSRAEGAALVPVRGTGTGVSRPAGPGAAGQPPGGPVGGQATGEAAAAAIRAVLAAAVADAGEHDNHMNKGIYR